MNIHEYQAKELLKDYGIPVPAGIAALSSAAALEAVEQLDQDVTVIKAQIHAGGRGKAGGVKIVKDKNTAADAIDALFGTTLVTPQTGSAGKRVNRLLIENGVEIEKEFYLSITIDRAKSQIVLIGSASGGMNIEEIAHFQPEKITREVVDPLIALPMFQARRLAFNMGIPAPLIQQATKLILQLYKLFVEKDCTIAEINPLVVTKAHTLLALDAKLTFDDNALYRHPELASLKDESEEDVREKEAAGYGLSYIALDGNIGCLVNGAGLAMATMDLLKYHGGSPANFLDVGGDATTDKVTEAFKIIMRDQRVKGIFVNIFGGIMKCDVIAKGIVKAANVTKMQLPLVVRLEGTNAEAGRRILANAALKVAAAESLDGGAQKIVSLVR